ncbi:RHS repeat-associated protein, partial [Mucilaginibacter frigoritolerans]
SYYYDAAGQKLRNIGSDGYWDYDSGIVYFGATATNEAIQFIQTEEGRAVPAGSNWNYEYNLKDHLGNVRLSFDKDPNADTARRIQEDEYYAFGLRNPVYSLSNNNRYLYNGKEVQTDLANQYDYGARFYDPVIGRWNSVDPLAELSRRWSPYNYVKDNPIRYIDPDGMLEYGHTQTDWQREIQEHSHVIAGRAGGSNNGSTPPDWVMNNTTHQVRDDPNVHKASDTKPGETYIGKTGSYVATNGAGVDLKADGSWRWSSMNVGDPSTVFHGFDTAGLSGLADMLEFVAYGMIPGAGATMEAVAEETGSHSVYQGLDAATGEVKYVGITSREVTTRWAEHIAAGGEKSLLRFETVEGATGLTRQQARIWEQNLINSHGLDNLLNKINSIAPKNWSTFGIQ